MAHPASLLALLLTVAIVRAIVGPLKRALHDITHRDGDLSQRLAVPGTDELSQLYGAFNEATEATAQLVRNIQRSALSVEVASGEISQGNQDLAQRTEQQSASIEETAARARREHICLIVSEYGRRVVVDRADGEPGAIGAHLERGTRNVTGRSTSHAITAERCRGYRLPATA